MTVMRHFLAIRPLPIGMAEPALTAALVALPGRAHRRTASPLAAVLGAIPMAAITMAAEEELLQTTRLSTDDVAKRIHRPGEDAPKTGSSLTRRETTTAFPAEGNHESPLQRAFSYFGFSVRRS